MRTRTRNFTLADHLQQEYVAISFATWQRINTDFLTHYCVVRADLPFGTQAAQLIHAAGYSTDTDLPPGTYAIALHVSDEAQLRGLDARLTAAHIDHILIVEEDAPYAGQAMAIGIRPCNRRLLKPYLSSYALVTQPGRVPGVMTQEAPGSNPGERATFAPVAQR